MEKLFSFDERLAFSYSRILTTDVETIKLMIPGCAHVEQSSREMDRKGADYIAMLRSGRKFTVDAKSRQKGCGSYWKHGEPELALERWSVVPCPRFPRGKIGWTLDSSKITDFVLFTFDPSDTELAYLVPFQHLRKAFIRFGKCWLDEYGPMAQQITDGRYKSACLFVPAIDVLNAIRTVCIGTATNGARIQTSAGREAIA